MSFRAAPFIRSLKLPASACHNSLIAVEQIQEYSKDTERSMIDNVYQTKGANRIECSCFGST